MEAYFGVIDGVRCLVALVGLVAPLPVVVCCCCCWMS